MLELPTPDRTRPGAPGAEALTVRMNTYVEMARVGMPVGKPICVRIKPMEGHVGFDSTNGDHHAALCAIARDFSDDLRCPVYVAGTSLHIVLLSRGAGLSRDDMFLGGNLQAIVAYFTAMATYAAVMQPALEDILRPLLVAQIHATPTALEGANWSLLRFFRNAQALERTLAREYSVPVPGRTQAEILADLETCGVVIGDLPAWRRFGTLILPDGVEMPIDLNAVENRVGFLFHGDTPITEE